MSNNDEIRTVYIELVQLDSKFALCFGAIEDGISENLLQACLNWHQPWSKAIHIHFSKFAIGLIRDSVRGFTGMGELL